MTSDAHPGLVEAIAANLPGTSWQRCRTHYAANLMAVTPKAMWPAVKAMLHSVYDQPDAPTVHAQFDRLMDSFGGVVGPDLGPDVFGERGEGQDVGAGGVEVFGDVGQFLGDVPPPRLVTPLRTPLFGQLD